MATNIHIPAQMPKGAVVRRIPPRGAVLRPIGHSARTDDIGKSEPATGRPVLQQSPLPEVNQAAATAEHPEVRRQLSAISRQIPGAKLAGARDEKDPERLDEKMDAEGQSPRTVRDYSGFRVAVDTHQAHHQVAAALRQHFEVPDEQDEFEKGNPETGFHGHTMQVRLVQGLGTRDQGADSPVTHEVQILPREVAAAADAEHGVYEKARAGDAGAQARLKTANEANWAKFEARNSSGKGGRGAGAPADEDLSAGARSPERGSAAGGTQPAAEPKYKHGNTQANIPAGSPAAAALDKFRKSIPTEHLAGDGKDVGDGGNHVTVRYGIDGDDTSGIEKYLAAQKPFTAKLGETGVFPPSEHSDGAAVVHARVESPELTRMNTEIAQHGKFAPGNFKDYKPHATVAYIDPKHAEAYKGRGELKGAEFPVDSVHISDRQGNQREVKLGGGQQQGSLFGDSPKDRFKAMTDKRRAKPPDNKPAADDKAEHKGWIGVDLDGTLAQYDGFKGPTVIGAPIPEMVDRVKKMLASGEDVRIFTARVNDDPGGKTRNAIEAWSKEHIGQVLPITDKKDHQMKQLWDDRAVGVKKNTGRIATGEQEHQLQT